MEVARLTASSASPSPVLGGLCCLACLPFQTSDFLNLFQKETQDSFWSQGRTPHKILLLKQRLQRPHGSRVPSAVAPSSESTDAALGFALVAGAFNPVVEGAGRQVAGPPFPGTYVAVRPLAESRKLAGT